MIENLNELLTNLDDEITLVETSLELISRERDAMIAYSRKDILECQKVRSSIILRSKKLEESRRNLLEPISQRYEISMSDLTLSGLAEKADGEDASKLKESLNRLRELFKDVTSANEENRKIASRSIAFIDNSIKVLSGYCKSDAPVYLSSGEIGKQEFAANRMVREA